jgi:hypothetical protein
MNAAHSLDEFVRDCAQRPETVQVWSDVIGDADRCFGLSTRDAIVKFVAAGGLEKPRLLESKLLEKALPRAQIMVDSYEFRTGCLCGYVAYYRAQATGTWVVKSFKHSHQTAIGDVSKSAQFKQTLRALRISPKSLPKKEGEHGPK